MFNIQKRVMRTMVFGSLSRKRTFLLICVVTLLGYGLIAYINLFINQYVMDKAKMDRIMSINSRQSLLLDMNGPCQIPDLPINSSILSLYLKEVEPLECVKGGQDWVKCSGDTCAVQKEILVRMKSVSCNYKDILWSTDHVTKLSENVIQKQNRSTYVLEASDFVDVNCEGVNLEGVKESWSGYGVGIRKNLKADAKATWEKLNGQAMRYNVLMFGFDSLSRNTFIRKLPKSYKTMTKLGAHVLEGYNILGDGTPQALIPMLTGYTELELPDTRKRMGDKADFVDVYPFIWKIFSDLGYITSFNEDTPNVGIFTYRLKGFSSQPTDHYLRQYLVHTDPKTNKWSPYCNGDTPRHKIMLDYTKQFMHAYPDKPRFIFSFHGELSHDDYNLVQAADEDLSAWLEDLEKSNVLENTILVIMSDHGHRFAEIRNTLQGKQEERMPWFSFVLPPNLETVRPNGVSNFKDNTRKLSSAFDIHATLMDIVGLNPNENYDMKSKFPPRSLSLFGPIPTNRTCGQAAIEPHWCACLTWKPISARSDMAFRLAEHLVMAINKLLDPFSDMCAKLVLEKIEWVTSLAVADSLLEFKKTSDVDGFLPDLSGKTMDIVKMYQIKVRLVPGLSLFEASLTHRLDDDSIVVKLSDISRINKYGDQARCVYESQPQLRKYCYCKRD